MQKDTISQGTPSKMEGTSSNGIFYLTQATPVARTSGKQHSLTRLGTNNNINDYLIKYNVIPKNSQATLGGLTLEGNHSGKQHLPLSDLGVFSIKKNSKILRAPILRNNSSNHREVFRFYKAF